MSTKSTAGAGGRRGLMDRLGREEVLSVIDTALAPRGVTEIALR